MGRDGERIVKGEGEMRKRREEEDEEERDDWEGGEREEGKIDLKERKGILEEENMGKERREEESIV